MPTFVSSWFAILVERPSRRGLLSLYVTNIVSKYPSSLFALYAITYAWIFVSQASETLYYMLVDRGVVKPKPFADVFIFTTSISCLLYLFRSQYRSSDSIYSLIRYLHQRCYIILKSHLTAFCHSFIVGPHEQIGYSAESPKAESDVPFPLKAKPIKGASTSRGSRPPPSALHNALRVYRHAVQFFHFYIKNIMRCQYCSHPHGCLHYWFQVRALRIIVFAG